MTAHDSFARRLLFRSLVTSHVDSHGPSHRPSHQAAGARRRLFRSLGLAGVVAGGLTAALALQAADPQPPASAPAGETREVASQDVASKDLETNGVESKTVETKSVERLAPYVEPRETIVNSIGMKFVRIPAGSFVMGSPVTERNRYDSETQHPVTLTRDFYLGVYEVTIGQFREFVERTEYVTDAEKGSGGFGYDFLQRHIVGPDPRYSWRRTGFPQTDNHPAGNLSWNDATAFCQWLSEVEGVRYRLPTEAEWEYSCRAGTQTRYCWGVKRESLIGAANIRERSLVFRDSNTAYDAERWNDGFAFSSPVGSFAPNLFGLYDINGNVWEWCCDWFGELGTEHQIDPQGPPTGEKRNMRGGSWYNMQILQRAALRYPFLPDRSFHSTGMRVLREALISPAEGR